MSGITPNTPPTHGDTGSTADTTTQAFDQTVTAAHQNPPVDLKAALVHGEFPDGAGVDMPAPDINCPSPAGDKSGLKPWLPSIGLGALGLVSGGIALGKYQNAEHNRRGAIAAEAVGDFDRAEELYSASDDYHRGYQIFGAISGVSIGASILISPLVRSKDD